MKSCYEESFLRSFIQCELSEEEGARIETHIHECESCRELLEQLEREVPPMFQNAEPDFYEEKKQETSFTQFWERFSKYLETEDKMELPQSIGFYELQSVLGKGGMGIVYQAEHKMLHRKVAVKFIRHKKVISPEFTERFQQEIISAGKLFHPNVVTTMDAGNFNGKPYLVMELLEGESLARRVRRDGPLPMTEAVGILIQACRGIQHAHSFGLLHCDVKPSNLWLQTDGSVKVLDLGLAQLRSALNDSVHYGGTPLFMSPEQSNQLPIDERTDIYALGRTLYFTLTGNLPKKDEFDRQEAAQTGVRIPEPLLRIIQKMAHPDKEKRFRDISDVTKALLPFSTEHSTKLLISLGYVSMLISLMFIPILFGILAIVFGVINKKKGSTFHGRLQIWMAPVCMGIGIVVGIAIWHSIFMEAQLNEELKRLENLRNTPRAEWRIPETILPPPPLLEGLENANGPEVMSRPETREAPKTKEIHGPLPENAAP